MTKFIFLDRDGVLNKYPGDKKYVTSLSGFKILKGSLAAVRDLTKAGYKIYVISNQAGVTKGIYTKKTLNRITSLLLKRICSEGGKIQRVYYCLHTNEMNCDCRKPKDGLLKKATKGKDIDYDNSYFIGDSLMDVKAGKTFGCKTILVLSGREKLKNASLWDVKPDFIAKSLYSATKNIINKKYERA